jgi:hypothetical protein
MGGARCRQDEPDLMRRGLAILALVLVLVGIELSTEAITLLVLRLVAGATALAAGAEFHVSSFRFVVGALALLSGSVLGGLVVWADSKEGAVSSYGSDCPRCGAHTRRVKRRDWHRLLSFVIGERLSRRKCETCGWVGLSLGN